MNESEVRKLLRNVKKNADAFAQINQRLTNIEVLLTKICQHLEDEDDEIVYEVQGNVIYPAFDKSA